MRTCSDLASVPASSAELDVAIDTRHAMPSAMQPDDLSSHRVRSNRWPEPAPTPQPQAALIQAVNDVYDAGEWKL